MSDSKTWDVVILGAGACGLMCGIQASKRGLKVLILEKLSQAGRKILISGGGRCNFTNLNAQPENYLSESQHFKKSVLREWSSSQTIAFFESLGVYGKEKKLGQLFPESDDAHQVRDVLLEAFLSHQGKIYYETTPINAQKTSEGFLTVTQDTEITSKVLVIATGGLAYPQLGASDFALKIARQFNLDIIEPKPALVPLTLPEDFRPLLNQLQGLSLPVKASYQNISFTENILFAHFGLTGPVILQISSYLEIGQPLTIDFLPQAPFEELLAQNKHSSPKKQLNNFLTTLFPEKFLALLDLTEAELMSRLGDINKTLILQLKNKIHHWTITPNGTMGFVKAEVMRGGIATKELQASTLEVKKVPGLYFGGEAIDVTGWLGGYNFQWAWACGYVIGKKVLSQENKSNALF